MAQPQFRLEHCCKGSQTPDTIFVDDVKIKLRKVYSRTGRNGRISYRFICAFVEPAAKTTAFHKTTPRVKFRGLRVGGMTSEKHVQADVLATWIKEAVIDDRLTAEVRRLLDAGHKPEDIVLSLQEEGETE